MFQGQGGNPTRADSDPEAAMETAPSAGSADSVDSTSPRSSRGGESWDEPSAAAAAAAANTSSQLRLMCSYGGHIGPRPHDRKALCYLGGETRIVVVDRHSTIADLHARLSRSLLGGRPFILKYQLPCEGLDSLISVATDEDLENMVEEFDRVAGSARGPSAAVAGKSARLRLFLFPVKPEPADLSSSSIGSLLDDSNKSETWFFDALNGAVLRRNHSSASSAASSVDCLLGLDNTLLLPSQDSSDKSGGGIGHGAQDVQSMPDSPMLETASSFGSASSAPSLSSLPPLRVRPDDRNADPRGIDAGVEGRFSQMNVHGQQKQQHQQPLLDVEGFKHHLQHFPAPPPGPPLAENPKPNLSPTGNPKSSADFSSDDDKLVQRSPPQQLPQQPIQGQQVPENPNVLDLLLSGDAVSRSVHHGQERPPAASNPRQPEGPVSDTSYRFPVHVTGQGYLLHPMSQYAQQQQNANPHLSHNLHANTTVLPIPSYYHQVLIHPQQQLAQPAAHTYSPQVPVYFLPLQYNPAHNIHVQPKLGDAVTTAPIPTTNKPTIPPPNSAPAPAQRQELSANVYQTGLGAAPALPQPPLPTQLIHMDQSHEYVRYHPLHHPASQSEAAIPVAASYGYEYGDAVHAYQTYYTQATAAAVPTQYQVSAGQVTAEHPLALQWPADSKQTNSS